VAIKEIFLTAIQKNLFKINAVLFNYLSRTQKY